MRDHRKPLLEAVLITSLLLFVPEMALSHVGHGDEFQAEGGINRVQVNPQTDPILGIEVMPIEPAADGSATVLVPITALVDADGKQLAFVRYGDFYEPVPVTTGATQGDRVEVTSGLSVGEQLVTQGSLSLYAESRKTQTADAVPSGSATSGSATPASEAATSLPPDVTHAQADAQGIPHRHDAAGNPVQVATAGSRSPKSSMSLFTAIGGGAVVLVGAIALLGSGRRKKGIFSNKGRGF